MQASGMVYIVPLIHRYRYMFINCAILCCMCIWLVGGVAAHVNETTRNTSLEWAPYYAPIVTDLHIKGIYASIGSNIRERVKVFLLCRDNVIFDRVCGINFTGSL